MQVLEGVLKDPKEKTALGIDNDDVEDKKQHMEERISGEEQIMKLKYKIKRKEIALINTKGEIFEAMKELQRLQSVMEDLQEKHDQQRGKLGKMAERLCIPIGLRPSQHIEEHQLGRSRFLVTIKPCALCGADFPQMDVIVASYQCTYHPSQVVMQNMINDQCAKKKCQMKFI